MINVFPQSLLKDITPDTSGLEANTACRDAFATCPDSSTADIVQQYAMNNTSWHQDFGSAFQILMEHGYSKNHLVPAGENLPTLVDPTVNTPDLAVHHVQSAVLVVAVSAVISLLL